MNSSQLSELLEQHEGYSLEFKEAKNGFNRQLLYDYCAAIANGDGGHLILGVDDNRTITGTAAFDGTWNKLANTLSRELDVRVRVYEIIHPEGRVLVFRIDRHYAGRVVRVTSGSGKFMYPIRDGESLVEMSAQTYREITGELQVDFSSLTVDGVSVGDLDQNALYEYRMRWASHTKNSTHLSSKYPAMLSDIGVLRNGKITNTALLLFGTEELLSQYLPDAEIVFEWRNDANDIKYGARLSWRKGFIASIDDIWAAILARNTVFRLQEGFLQREIDAYDEESIREAVINAFVHRDYTVQGTSIVIKASPDKFFIENPGSLMAGVTVENIIDKSVYRNRLLAETLEKINVMERSSQGVDTIFTRSIEAGKGRPVYEVTSDPSVRLTIPAKLVDEEFIKFIEELINKKNVSLSTKEILELELVRTGEKQTDLQHKDNLLKHGLIESYGRGRGAKYILSHRYYTASGNPGEYTRIKGLPREVKRAIILEHLKKNKKTTSAELQVALPDLTATEVSTLLKGMSRDGLIEYEGESPRWGYWTLIRNKE